MTSNEILVLSNDKIRSDKFAAAAISYIYKAFGDIIRSKEIWPFSGKNEIDLDAYKNINVLDQFDDAIYLLKMCKEKYQQEVIDNMEKSVEDSKLKNMKSSLKRINSRVNNANDITEAINKTTEETSKETNNIIG